MWPFKKKKTEREKIIDEIKKEHIDFSALMVNIENRDKLDNLAKRLSSIIHPDRFVDRPEKRKEADSLFKEVQAAKNDYSRLLELSKTIERFIES